MAGQLYIVATPIGNLGDISHRARNTLEQADLILAEDTRHSGMLLSHLGIKKPLMSLHAHNERERTEQIIDKLRNGSDIALISDAGTPLISDPGFLLVREARKEHLQVSPIPGPSAVVAALSVSGLSCDRFVFEGFLPAKSAARIKYLKSLSDEPRTMVFYESPHRITGTIHDMASVFGDDHVAVIARELTKTFEQIEQSTLAGLKNWLEQSDDHLRGEMVIVLSGSEQKSLSSQKISNSELLQLLLQSLPIKEAARIASTITGEAKNKLYNQALEMKQKK